jgi:anti-sigma factor RsiW
VTRHVDRWLIAYVEGQLPPQDARCVREHVAVCAACRDKLTRHEHLGADLRLALSSMPTPRPVQLRRWWQLIQAPASVPVSGGVARVLLPALLSLILLVLPLMTGLGTAAASGTGALAVAPNTIPEEAAQPVTTPESRPVAIVAATETEATPEPLGQPRPLAFAPATPPAP